MFPPLTQNMKNFMIDNSVGHNNCVPFSSRPNPYVYLKCMNQSRPNFVLQVMSSLFLQNEAI